MSEQLTMQEKREETERKAQDLSDELLGETEGDDLRSRVAAIIYEDDGIHEVEDLNIYINEAGIEAQGKSQSTSNPEAEDLIVVDGDEEPEEKISVPDIAIGQA
ncbi:hypothetical protein DFQ29_009272 [Apophysomyces sp. BC1021]|nr:hypothetical protein DFQ29_009272 [Apophysomyces sp. BC1021]